MSVYNFCAGPAMLPAEVMQQAQSEYINWNNTGCSVMELSHRSKEFIAVYEAAVASLRELLNIDDSYSVLFMHGGGRGQFAAVPMNLMNNGTASYFRTGSWSKSAVEEAQKFGSVEVQDIVTEENGLKSVTAMNKWQIATDASYMHYCPNETVDGIEIFEQPNFDVPVVADMSSNILSRNIDVNNYDLIYAGAQKNIGPSGLSIVIIKNELLARSPKNIPSIFNYQLTQAKDSMFNTPPTFAIYLAKLVFDWLKGKGGVTAIEQVNKQKAELLYQAIDGSSFYSNNIATHNRSRMNVPFFLADESLNEVFLKQAKDAGLLALKGHRIVGGMRASIYNAMPIEGVTTLTEFMKEFERTHG